MSSESTPESPDHLGALRRQCEELTTVAEKARVVVETLCVVLNTDVSIVRRRRGAWLNLMATYGIQAHELPPAVAVNEGLAARMIRDGQTVVVEDVSRAEVTRNLHTSARDGSERRKLIFRSFAGTPLKAVDDRVVGVIGVYSIWDNRRFSPDDIAFLEAAAALLGRVVAEDDKKNESGGSKGVIRLRDGS